MTKPFSYLYNNTNGRKEEEHLHFPHARRVTLHRARAAWQTRREKQLRPHAFDGQHTARHATHTSTTAHTTLPRARRSVPALSHWQYAPRPLRRCTAHHFAHCVWSISVRRSVSSRCDGGRRVFSWGSSGRRDRWYVVTASVEPPHYRTFYHAARRTSAPPPAPTAHATRRAHHTLQACSLRLHWDSFRCVRRWRGRRQTLEGRKNGKEECLWHEYQIVDIDVGEIIVEGASLARIDNT